MDAETTLNICLHINTCACLKKKNRKVQFQRSVGMEFHSSIRTEHFCALRFGILMPEYPVQSTSTQGSARWSECTQCVHWSVQTGIHIVNTSGLGSGIYRVTARSVTYCISIINFWKNQSKFICLLLEQQTNARMMKNKVGWHFYWQLILFLLKAIMHVFSFQFTNHTHLECISESSSLVLLKICFSLLGARYVKYGLSSYRCIHIWLFS